MQQVGLAKVGIVKANEWAGVDRLRVKAVYVEGPFKSTKDAIAAAQSLAGVEAEANGGLYVVSALLSSHVDADVHQVAGCLAQKGTTPSGSGKPLTF